ncbi:TPA: holin family protein [Bacillus cereus]|uniref:phage holin family protein n=1 Tax=Bacillus sp. ISTL8 TaxID=2596896 RepID=UPI00145700E8|nr:phage holin family protein [Bacillus sp. ISTL8]
MKFENLNEVSVIFAGGMTGLTALLGGWDKPLQVIVACVILDILTGMLKGWRDKSFSSRRMREGFTTKIGYFIVIMLATMFDGLMPETAPLLRTVAVWFYIFVEGVSVLENLASLGVPIPQGIVDRLSQVKGKGGNRANFKDGKFDSMDEKN